MAVDPIRYRPMLVDEHLNMRDVDNDGDLDATLCRAAASLMALDAWTSGEITTTPVGTKWRKAKIRSALGLMRKATGEPDRHGYNQSHTADFVRAMGEPVSAFTIFNRSMTQIKAKLREGFVVTLAGDVGYAPAGSPLRRYVNPGVGHEIIITRLSKDESRAAFIDPMTPHGTAKYERWAPWSHFVGYAERFGAPAARVAEIWKRGYGSLEEAQRRRKAAWRETAIDAERQHRLAQSRIGVLEEELADAKQALALCEASDDNLRIEELESALSDIRDRAHNVLP